MAPKARRPQTYERSDRAGDLNSVARPEIPPAFLFFQMPSTAGNLAVPVKSFFPSFLAKL